MDDAFSAYLTAKQRHADVTPHYERYSSTTDKPDRTLRNTNVTNDWKNGGARNTWTTLCLLVNGVRMNVTPQ
jgi:hypothetical protein